MRSTLGSMRPGTLKTVWRPFGSKTDGVISTSKENTSGIRPTKPRQGIREKVMNQQQYSREGERSYRGEARTNRGNSESRSNREGWTGLLNSMIKFTNAATMFTIQQVQNSFLLMTDSREAVNRFRRAMERLSESMNSEMDSSERSTVDQMNRAGEQMVNA